MNPEKRKENSQRRIPPLHPPQTEFGLCRLGNTDFQDKAEFVSFQAMSKELPADFGRRKGEPTVDMRIYAEELLLIGFDRGSKEMAQAMARMAKELL